MLKKHVHQKLILECLIVYGSVPLIIAITRPRGWIYMGLWGFTALALHELRKRGYNFKHDWNWAALNRSTIMPILRRFLPCAIGMLIFTWILIPEQLFSLPHKKPLAWVAVMVLYPLLSVVPQEILFRTYYLGRYHLFMSPNTLRLTSAIAFGWVHIVLLNWVAVVFSMVGGVFFAETYLKTKSLACVCFEHALYGCYLFSIGLGYYFYHGQAVH